MPVEPIDLVAVISVVMGISVVLVPVIGLTARFALKPTVEALSRFFENRTNEETLSILDRRMSLIEQQVDAIETSVRRIADVSEFHHELGAPNAPPIAPGDPETTE